MTLRREFHAKVHAAQVLAGFIRDFSNWREVWGAYKSGKQLPEFHLRGGLTLAHAQDDVALITFREIFREHPYSGDGFYRPTAADTVVDIGANIGIFVVYLQSRARGITVHCFEPGSSTRSRLERNLSINRLQSCVFVYPYAVSDKNGAAHLAQRAYSVQRALMRDAEGAPAAEPVESVTLARALELCGASYIDLLKIDIEGDELEVVLGSQPDDWKRVKRVALEYHGGLRPGCREKLAAALRERGFANIRCLPSPHEPDQGILHANR